MKEMTADKCDQCGAPIWWGSQEIERNDDLDSRLRGNDEGNERKLGIKLVCGNCRAVNARAIVVRL